MFSNIFGNTMMDTFTYTVNNFKEGSFFTQSELDQLKTILSEQIQYQERELEYDFLDLNVPQWREDVKKSIKKRKKRIKMLANLQYKVKHTLLTMG